MDRRHPETELIAYLKNELAPEASAEVARHLDGCAQCRGTLTAFRQLLDGLGHATADVPEVQWRRYRAELRTRLEANEAQRRRGWWRNPLPVAVSAGLATAVVVLALLLPSSPWRVDERRARSADGLNGFEETVLGTRLDLLQQYSVVERLDLLEDLDVIRQLDGLTEHREG